jgi:hypothetical protein
MAYPVDWIDPKHDWVSNDGIANTDLNRIERDVDLLGERLFDHIGLAGEWYFLGNPAFYFNLLGRNAADGDLATTGLLDHFYYMQIDKTIWIRGQILLSTATGLYSLYLIPSCPPLFYHNYPGIYQLCGGVSWELAAAREPGSAMLKTINGTQRVVCLQAINPVAVASLDCYFYVSYEQQQLFTPLYGATSTTSTTQIPSTTTVSP